MRQAHIYHLREGNIFLHKNKCLKKGGFLTCRALGVGEITAHGSRHSAATILLNHVGKDLREIQELLRHKNICTTVRYIHVGYEQTRQTAEALSDALK